jgi:hypothetical protein
MRIIVVTMILALCASTAAAADHYVLRNSSVNVVVDLGTGAIAELHDLHTPDSTMVFHAGESILQIAAGDMGPLEFTVIDNGPDFVTIESQSFHGSSSSLPLLTTITYRLNGYELSVDYKFQALSRLDMINGLDITIASSAWNYFVIGNQFAQEGWIVLGEPPGIRRRALDQVYEIRSSRRNLRFIFPNPYESFATITTSGAHSFKFRWQILVSTPPPQAVAPKGPSLASVLPAGTQLLRQIKLVLNHADEVGRGKTSPLAYFSPFPNGYDQVIAMTFDDVPFGRWVPLQPSINPDTLREAYLLTLLKDHPKMKMGWIVLPDEIFSEQDLVNPDYPPGKWWLAHGRYRMWNHAPPAYLQWLRNIDRDSLVYGYENRVHLGSHGYHHTPEMTFGNNYEFQSYNPASDDSTFSAIAREFSLLGLTHAPKWIRFPGFEFTRSAIDALIRHQYILFDYWGIYDKLPWMLFYSDYGHIWGIGTQWEGDTPNTFQDMDLILRAGRLCETAGHPYKWFDGDSATAYTPINVIFQQAENKYPNLGYMFPDEVGSFADEIYDIHDIRTGATCDTFFVYFTGAAASGQTLMLEWPGDIPLPTVASVDGSNISNMETRGRRIVLRMSVLANARHIVRLPASLANLCSADAPPSRFVLAQNYPNPFNGGTAISYDLPRGARVKLVIYNAAGESVAVLVDREQPPGSYTVAWNGLNRGGRRAASGVYFYRLQTGYASSVRKLVLVR